MSALGWEEIDILPLFTSYNRRCVRQRRRRMYEARILPDTPLRLTAAGQHRDETIFQFDAIGKLLAQY